MMAVQTFSFQPTMDTTVLLCATEHRKERQKLYHSHHGFIIGSFALALISRYREDRMIWIGSLFSSLDAVFRACAWQFALL